MKMSQGSWKVKSSFGMVWCSEGDSVYWHTANVVGNTELEGVVSRPCPTHEDTDDVLRSFIELAATHKRRLRPGLPNGTWA